MSDHEHKAMKERPICQFCGLWLEEPAKTAEAPEVMSRKDALRKGDEVMLRMGYRTMREL